MAIWLALVASIGLAAGLYYYIASKEKSNAVKIVTDVTQEKSIAVLPLKNWTGNPDLEYVSDGMTDAVISRLANIQSIDRVVPFTSILGYKETNKSIQEIATELGVEKVLQGNLQIAGQSD
ncbi:hypothetical protein ACU8V7_25610 [Zobellia nedashkovskayae]